MYGVTREQLAQFYAELQAVHGTNVTSTDLRRLKSSLCLCALNCSWEQLSDLQVIWTGPEDLPVSVRNLRENFHRIADLCRSPSLMNPSLRFRHGVPWLSEVTCMLDVTTIPCRAKKPHMKFDPRSQTVKRKDSTYSGKHGEHCFKIEFWLTLAGVPIFFRGPVVGSVHDARIYQDTMTHGTYLFEHHKDEIFLADLGYVGCYHCLVPYKTPNKGMLEDDQLRVNERLALVRSRVERFFAHVDKFRFFWATDHDLSWIKDAVQIVSVLAYGLLAGEPQYDFDTGVNASLRKIDHLNKCWCSEGCEVVEKTGVSRDLLKEHINYVPYEPRKPRKRKK